MKLNYMIEMLIFPASPDQPRSMDTTGLASGQTRKCCVCRLRKEVYYMLELMGVQSLWNHLDTEQSNPRYNQLDISSTEQILALMNEADEGVPLAVARALPDVARAVDLIVGRLRRGGRLVYMGAGTSGRLGVLDAAECPPTFSTSTNVVVGLIAGGREAMFEAAEEVEDHPLSAHADLAALGLSNLDVVVGVTASGRTPYVLGGLGYARKLGAGTVAVSCNLGAMVSQEAEIAIEIDTGPEVLMGSTRLKAGTAEKLVLNMLSTASMVRLGKAYHNLMVDLKVTNEKLTERAKRIIMMATGVTYSDAASALAAAEGHVKMAILMVKRQVDAATAEQLLQEANGFLRLALGEEPLTHA